MRSRSSKKKEKKGMKFSKKNDVEGRGGGIKGKIEKDGEAPSKGYEDTKLCRKAKSSIKDRRKSLVPSLPLLLENSPLKNESPEIF